MRLAISFRIPHAAEPPSYQGALNIDTMRSETPTWPRAALRRAYFVRRCAALALGALLAVGASAELDAAAPYDIEIKKAERVLILRDGRHVMRTFPIALGRGGKGDKLKIGDNKTPIGTYRIVALNDRSQFDMFLRLNYPNVKDAFYGMKDERITRAEFRAILRALRNGRVPPQDTPLGGSIGIHGIGEETPDKLQIHETLDWTRGCIALRNADLHTLRRFVDIGTRVVIRE